MASAIPFASRVNPLPWLAVYTEPQLDKLQDHIQVLPTLFRLLAALCFLPVAALAFVRTPFLCNPCHCRLSLSLSPDSSAYKLISSLLTLVQADVIGWAFFKLVLRPLGYAST